MIPSLWRRLIRFGFRLLYNEFAFTYDSVSQLISLRHWREWQRLPLRYLGDCGGGFVLELAHGTGNTQCDLLRAGYRSMAMDLSPAMARLARRKLGKAGLETDFTRGDALALPFQDACFAAVVCAFPTAFITEAACLSEIRRVLKPDGAAVIVLAGKVCGAGWPQRAIGWLYRITGQGEGWLSSEAIQQIFAGAGFSVEVKTADCGGSLAQVAILKQERC